MIVFDLACAHGHRFEGWFPSGEAFERQCGEGLVQCPVCESGEVRRLPSARVNVGRAAPPAPRPAAAKAAAAPAQEAMAGLPPEMLARLREIVRASENVGARFPEEARRIHYNEVPARSIRGQASAEEAQSLLDEGIDFASLPDFLTAEGH